MGSNAARMECATRVDADAIPDGPEPIANCSRATLDATSTDNARTEPASALKDGTVATALYVRTPRSKRPPK